MNTCQYPMAGYFQHMPVIGGPVNRPDADNTAALKQIEQQLSQAVAEVLASGRSDESLNRSGQWTAMQRIEYLVDEGYWHPLNSLLNTGQNADGSTGVISGLGRIHNKWTLIIASDNKKMAGAWVPGQAEKLLRGSDIAKRLNIPLVYVLNCSGVKLDEQEKVYPGRRGGGTPFYRNAELEIKGVPVLVAIYGTNPAGGGYHAISPTVLIAHEDANMAVGGAGIVSGMNPKGYIDEEGAAAIIEAAKQFKADVPGAVAVHHEGTGFFREVYATEQGVLDAIKKYVDALPAYGGDFFRVDEAKEPLLPADDLYDLIPLNPKRGYDFKQVLARLVDGSEFLEYRGDYGPEIVAGLVKLNGYLCGVIGNAQGFFLKYPEYYEAEDSIGVGGKLYRQGLIKMSEFVTLCARDRLPLIWIQDTTGIDVGNIAEKAELLGLGQSLIYSIQNADIPQLEITLRKGTAAAHYVMGGPQGNDTNAFSLGTAATEIYVMHGETASVAMYSRRLVKEREAGNDIQPVIEKMNGLIQAYYDKSRPGFCAQSGMVDEIANLTELRSYMCAFAGSAWQNPLSFCPPHQMLTPRAIREFANHAVHN